MKNTLIAATIALMSATTSVSASPFSSPHFAPDLLINKPIIKVMDELVCYGCISPNTGHIDPYFIEFAN